VWHFFSLWQSTGCVSLDRARRCGHLLVVSAFFYTTYIMWFIFKLQRRKYTGLVQYYTIYKVTKCVLSKPWNPSLEWRWPLCKDANPFHSRRILWVNYPLYIQAVGPHPPLHLSWDIGPLWTPFHSSPHLTPHFPPSHFLLLTCDPILQAEDNITHRNSSWSETFIIACPYPLKDLLVLFLHSTHSNCQASFCL
jgi:hypothetical protein